MNVKLLRKVINLLDVGGQEGYFSDRDITFIDLYNDKFIITFISRKDNKADLKRAIEELGGKVTFYEDVYEVVVE